MFIIVNKKTVIEGLDGLNLELEECKIAINISKIDVMITSVEEGCSLVMVEGGRYHVTETVDELVTKIQEVSKVS